MEESKTLKQRIEYSYDALHRLTRVQCGEEVSIHYAYDPAGNLVATGKEVETAPVNASAATKEPAPAKAEVATLQIEVEDAAEDEAVEAGAAEAEAETNRETWHIYRDGEQYGPFTWEELKGLAQEGRVGKDDFLWRPGMSEWMRADNREGLF